MFLFVNRNVEAKFNDFPEQCFPVEWLSASALVLDSDLEKPFNRLSGVTLHRNVSKTTCSTVSIVAYSFNPNKLVSNGIYIFSLLLLNCSVYICYSFGCFNNLKL